MSVPDRKENGQANEQSRGGTVMTRSGSSRTDHQPESGAVSSRRGVETDRTTIGTALRSLYLHNMRKIKPSTTRQYVSIGSIPMVGIVRVDN